MRKGIAAAFIGVLVFMFVMNFVFIPTGFTIGALFIPIMIFTIAIIFITIVKKAAQADPKYQNHYTNNSHIPQVHCHKCNSLIEGDANYCPVCGASQNDMVKCEYCGHENPKTNALCEKCNGFLNN